MSSPIHFWHTRPASSALSFFIYSKVWVIKNLASVVPLKKPIFFTPILGTCLDTQDTSPLVLLFFDKQRFIFNAGEGLQRYCTEHKIKLSKIDHIFLSRVCSETAAGLPGLLLKDLKLKVRKLNPVNTTSYVRILGTGLDTQDTSPSVLLFFDK
ncbi:tRNAse Z TRZ4, mitochondrial-like isoform X2 [Rutidosis leptorrhynchoides]|uniref:tRNAse Z TRZ4, mitochondrial-like isoform X2 n=1 Tax=Rutidosis leptorrhynchoides TaxID=125765 RepID=UPI003A9A0A63